jgi:Calcium binding
MSSSFTPIPNPTPEADKAREKRIFEEIVVDANDDEDAEMGWFYYLLETLEFPFEAYVKAKKLKDDAARVSW